MHFRGIIAKAGILVSFGIIGIILSSILTIPQATADTWYVGKGLKQGDYFRYSVCDSIWKNCAPMEIDFWVKNQTQSGNGWNLEFFVFDNDTIHQGIITIGTSDANPTYSDHSVVEYANIYKDTIAWLDTSASKEMPRDFFELNWGKCGVNPCGFGPKGQEQISIQAGTFETWKIVNYWQSAYGITWIDPNLPFPVKGLLFGTENPIRFDYDFELLEKGNSKTPLVLHPTPCYCPAELKTLQIPSYVKQYFITNENSTEMDFFQFLLNDGKVSVNKAGHLEGSFSKPQWIKNTYHWWLKGQITDLEFANEIQYLMDNKIIY